MPPLLAASATRPSQKARWRRLPRWALSVQDAARRWKKMNGTVYTKRNYVVGSVAQAQQIAAGVMGTWDLQESTTFGLPEVDDRYHVWRVPLLFSKGRVGEIVIDARSGAVDGRRSTSRATVIARQRHAQTGDASVEGVERNDRIRRRVAVPEMRNTILSGPSEGNPSTPACRISAVDVHLTAVLQRPTRLRGLPSVRGLPRQPPERDSGSPPCP